MKSRVEYLGHYGQGLHPTEEKVTAIVNAPRPTNVTAAVLPRALKLLWTLFERFSHNLTTTS